MMATILTIIAGLIGVIGTVVAYHYGPQRRVDKINSELGDIVQKRITMERERDNALQKNNVELLTRIADEFIRLRQREEYLLQQRSKN
jgi:hypothetical protein